MLNCQQIAHDALSALINLTDVLAVAKQLMDEPFLVWLVSYTAVCPLNLSLTDAR